MGLGDNSSGFIVIASDGYFNSKVNGNHLGVDVSFSFSNVDQNLVVSPVGKSLDFNQKIGMEEFNLGLYIEIKSHVEVTNGDSQSSLKFNSDVVDFNSDSF